MPEPAELLDEKFQLEPEKLKKEEQLLKKEFNLDHLYDEINDGKTPEELEYYFGRSNINSFKKSKLC